MSYRLPPLTALRAFESAARHLSFKKAALELHVTPAAISQQIKALEDYLGLAVFRRLTRALELTPHGLAMLPKIREAFENLADAIETTRGFDDGPLTIAAPPSFASRWLVPRLPRFSSAHPEVELRITSRSDSIDRRGETAFFDDGLIDLRSASSQVAIRFGVGAYPGFRVDKIFSPTYVAVCSPQLPSRERPLGCPDDLRQHVLIHDDTVNDDGHLALWAQWLDVAGVDSIDTRRGPRFSNAVLAVEAALDGQGIALALRPLVESDLAAGRLIAPLAIAIPSRYAYFLVVPEPVARRTSVAAFSAWLLDEGRRVEPA
ncbi:MAG: transcriptional regulator, LysR family [Proteobacteria bacterium]|nr:transcriptional regulator, LysR family [Pseudomonadota bacterium]